MSGGSQPADDALMIPAHLITKEGMEAAILNLSTLVGDPSRHQLLLETLVGMRNITA